MKKRWQKTFIRNFLKELSFEGSSLLVESTAEQLSTPIRLWSGPEWFISFLQWACRPAQRDICIIAHLSWANCSTNNSRCQFEVKGAINLDLIGFCKRVGTINMSPTHKYINSHFILFHFRFQVSSWVKKNTPAGMSTPPTSAVTASLLTELERSFTYLLCFLFYSFMF